MASDKEIPEVTSCSSTDTAIEVTIKPSQVPTTAIDNADVPTKAADTESEDYAKFLAVPFPKEVPVVTSCSSTDTAIEISTPIKKVDDDDDETDGGIKGWMTIAGAFCAMFVQFGLNNSFGVFQAYYETHQLQAYSSDMIGWLAGVQQFLFLFGVSVGLLFFSILVNKAKLQGLITGRMLDAYGVLACLVPGSILLVLSLMITSVCREYYHFMLGQSVLFGIGAALIFSPIMSVPSQWFPKRRAMATAIAMCGSGLGGTLWPIALQGLIAKVGFGWALRIAGFISLALLTVACVLVRNRYPRRAPAPFMGTLSCFKDVTWCLMSFGSAIATMGCFMPLFYISFRADQLGASTALSFYMVSIMNASSTIGRLGASLGDYTGRFNLNIIATTIVGILLCSFWVALDSVNQLIGFAAVYGPVLGLLFSLNAPCAAQISKPHEVGARVGMMFAVNAPFNLVAVPINGAIVSRFIGQAGFKYCGAFSGACCLVGAALILMAKLRVNPRLLAKV